MPGKALAVFLMAVALSALSLAQTKISGTVKCGKPDQSQKIDVGDTPNHAFVITQGKCTWTKPMTIADLQTGSDVVTNSEEATSTGATVRGFAVGTMSNGDKFHVRLAAKDTYKDGKLSSSDGTFSFASGTGKLKGIQGKGTFKGKPDPDGSVVFDVEGEYTLAK
jgi:hypothetical protein